MEKLIYTKDLIKLLRMAPRCRWPQLMHMDAIYRCIAETPEASAVYLPEGGVGEVSDGYHTFNELYHHRAVLFSVICNLFPHYAWKSRNHSSPEDPMYEGMFIVGIETPDGQATYHYNLDPYWDMFQVPELEWAPKWDGHTPQQAIERIGSIFNGMDFACRMDELTLVAQMLWAKDLKASEVKLFAENIVWMYRFLCERIQYQVEETVDNILLHAQLPEFPEVWKAFNERDKERPGNDLVQNPTEE